MGKKKAFIDKKKSSTYHLLHRSQRDVAEDVLLLQDDDAVMGSSNNNNMVLWPADTTNNNLESTNQAVLQLHNNPRMAAWRQKLQQVGLLDDDQQQRERYLKPITGTGTFLDAATGQPVIMIAEQKVTATAHEEEAVLEVKNNNNALLFDSIPLTADCMDEDIAAVLFNDHDDDFDAYYEELNDDFVLEAAQEPDNDNDASDEFDFDNHIQKLLEKAKRNDIANTSLKQQQQQQQHHDWARQDQAYFAQNNVRALPNDDHDTITTVEPGVVAKLSPDEERALCEKFEATLAEYDQDSDDDDMNGQDIIHHGRPLQGDDIVEAALNDFLQEKQDEIFMQGTASNTNKKRNSGGGGSGFSVLVGTHMIPAKDLDDKNVELHEPVQPIDEMMAEARDILSQPRQKPPPVDEILMDDGGASYLSERQRNPWDCESILTTYSNLDNNPVTIRNSSTSSRIRRRRKKNTSNNKEQEEPVQHIRLSAKKGLPIGVFEKSDDGENVKKTDWAIDDDDTTTVANTVNRGQARNKKETPNEKKERKQIIKQQRQLARIQKKMTKQVFQEEFEKRVGGQDVLLAGKTVLRIS